MFSRKFQGLFSSTKSVISASTARSQSSIKTVTLIPGDGIGPEIAAAVQR